MIRILIADDHKLFRETLSDVLAVNPDFTVIASCSDTRSAIDVTRIESPDVVLMDINIGPLSGIEATRQIVSFSTTKVIGLSMHSNSGYAKNMIKAGARGYITKNSSKEEIFEAVRAVILGNKYICNEIKDIISDNMLNEQAARQDVSLLTVREIQIINHIREGLSSKEIARQLSISLKTVEVHRHNILKKLQLRNSASLVNFVYNNVGYFA